MEQPWRMSATLRSRSLARRGAGRRPETAGGWPRGSRAHGWREEKTQRSRTGLTAALPGRGAVCRAGSATAALMAAQQEEATPAGPALPEAPVTSTRGSCRAVGVARVSQGAGGGPPDLEHRAHSLSSFYQIHCSVKTKSPNMRVKEQSLRHPSRDAHSRPTLPGRTAQDAA